MILSLVMAWIATICGVLAAFQFLAKKNKRRKRFFHRIHILFGIVLMAAGVIHGLFAGNSSGTALSEASLGTLLFTWNMGTVCLILSVLLGATYLLRKVLKKHWMRLHRVLTLMFLIMLVIHIYQVGITLPHAFSTLGKDASNDIPHAESVDVTPEQEMTDSETFVTFSGASLKDGTYEGSAEGFKGTITVSVVVKNGLVTEISILDEKDTPQYFERAKEMIPSIIESQSLEVDAVTGATYSSKGILDAVYSALQNAVISGDLKITNIEISNGRGHGRRH